ncbi:MAG: hypothetical protein IJT72_00340 [Lachnospiraceae bacterium]|nr:hypothetical protein [Lachnospiraceae bacterium]
MDNNFNNQQGYPQSGQPNMQGYSQSGQPNMQGYPQSEQPDMQGYNDGYNDGNYDSGYNNGYDNGSYDNGGYNDGYNNGNYDNGNYDGGYNNGNYGSEYNNGYDNGYNDGYNNSNYDNGYNDGYYDDGYGYDNYMPKKKTGLIVAITAAIVVFIAAIAILIVMLVKGKDKKNSEDTSETTTSVSTELSTAATTEVVSTTDTTTEATTTEAPAPVPFAEEKGFTWSDPYAGLQLASYAFSYYDATGTHLTDDQIVFDNTTGNYTFGDITKSAPDASGYVTVTVPYTISTYIKCTVKDNISESYSATAYNRLLSYSDYYTGTQLKQGWDYNAKNWANDYVYTDITYNNQTIQIGVLVTDEYIHPEYSFVEQNDVGYVYDATTERHITLKFYIPADYDGLVLSIPKEGYTEAWYNATSYDDGTQTYNILGPDEAGWTYTPDQLYFIKVNDYIR